MAASCGGTARTSISPLVVREIRTPEIAPGRIRSRCLVIKGRYPQVYGSGRPLRRVNAVLRAAALADEDELVSHCVIRGLWPPPGYYEPAPVKNLMSASSVVFSALIPAGSIPPGANYSNNWASVTIRVRTATRVTVGMLFRSQQRGLRALAAAMRRLLVVQNPCFRGDVNTGVFEPSLANYRYFGLIPRGLAVGLPTETAGLISCGPGLVVIPYSDIRPYLDALGRELVGGVRAPLR